MAEVCGHMSSLDGVLAFGYRLAQPLALLGIWGVTHHVEDLSSVLPFLCDFTFPVNTYIFTFARRLGIAWLHDEAYWSQGSKSSRSETGEVRCTCGSRQGR